MKMTRAIAFMLAGIGLLGLANACQQTPIIEPGFIRYEVSQEPHRVVNNSPEEIEVLEPDQHYFWDDGIWIRFGCPGCTLPERYPTFALAPNKSRQVDRPASFICSEDSNCERFAMYRYRVAGQPGRTFIVYTNEGRPGDPSCVEGARVSISFSSTGPFRFIVHNDSKYPLWLCWEQTPHAEATWGVHSRLERQTVHGTWEMMPHTLVECKTGLDDPQIASQQSVEVDGTRAYPSYTQLPMGIYRWVMVFKPNPDWANDYLVFSPRFEWGEQKQ